jgi:putative transposase
MDEGVTPEETPNSDATPPPHWHSRGYIPHVDTVSLIQHVSIHLADSLPKSVLEKLRLELNHLPVEKQNAELRKRVSAWLDAGHGSCILRQPSIARMVQNSLLHFDAQRYLLLAWVVMPNHIHILFQPQEGWSVGTIVGSWKKFTARKIRDHIRDANQEIGVPGNPVWHREYWDRYIRDERHLQQTIDYIHQNPVKAALSPSPQTWPWSSAAPPGTPIS